MQRRRDIASAPRRSAGEAWGVITELVAVTLERSPAIDRSSVAATMAIASGVGRALIAGGHLESHPLVVVGGSLWLEIATVSGDRALTLTENLSPVPGGASAEEWRVHLPAVGPIAKAVKDVAKNDEHLSSDEPVRLAETSGALKTGLVNEEALARWSGDKS